MATSAAPRRNGACCNEKPVCADVARHGKCGNRLRYGQTWSQRNSTYGAYCKVSCGSCRLCTASEQLGRHKIVDVTQFNDELSVLRYRLRLHSVFADTFVVAETAITYAGFKKPLHATNGLTAEEKTRYNVRIFVIPVLAEIASPTKQPNWKRENHRICCHHQGPNAVGALAFSLLLFPSPIRHPPHPPPSPSERIALNKYLLEHFPRHLIFFSDVDELLDPEAVRNTLLPSIHLTKAAASAGCLTPRMRFYYYGVRARAQPPSRPAAFSSSSHAYAYSPLPPSPITPFHQLLPSQRTCHTTMS